MTYKRAMAAVYLGTDDVPFIVTETPSEVAHMVAHGPGGLIQLTLGNRSDRNGKPLYVRPEAVVAISAPKQNASGR